MAKVTLEMKSRKAVIAAASDDSTEDLLVLAELVRAFLDGDTKRVIVFDHGAHEVVVING